MLGSAGDSFSFLSLEISALTSGPLEIAEEPRNIWTPEEIRSIFGTVAALCGAEWQGATWKAKDPSDGTHVDAFMTYWHEITGLGDWVPTGSQVTSWGGSFFGAAAGQSEAAPSSLERRRFSLKCLHTSQLLIRQQTFSTIKIKLLFSGCNPNNIICI